MADNPMGLKGDPYPPENRRYRSGNADSLVGDLKSPISSLYQCIWAWLSLKVESETKACLQVVYFWMWPQEAQVQGRESETGKERKSVWGRAIEMTMDNWCSIPPRPSEGPHECDSDPLSRGSRGKHVSMAPVPQLPRLASCMACTSRISMQSQFLRFPCCKIRKASRQNNGKYLAQAWRAGLWPKLPQHGLEPRGFWRGDQNVAHAQWKASLLLHGDELHVYPETCQDINEDIWKFMLLRKHVLSKVRSLEESPQLAATWSQTLSRTEYAWMELN